MDDEASHWDGNPTGNRSIGAAVGWISMSQVIRQVLNILVTSVLARLLLPSDFGLMSVTVVVVGVLALARDLGTGVTIVRAPALTPRLLSTLFWVNVGLGLTAALGVAISAPTLAALFGEPALADIVTVSALAFVVSSLAIVQTALLERAMRFRTVAGIEVASIGVGSGVAVASALGGLGVWSLVAQMIATAATSGALYTIAGRWRPTREFSIADLRDVGRFGLGLTGFNLFNYAARNADYVMIGAALGAAPLGQYTLAYRAMLYPLQAVAGVISRATFPVYARLQTDDAAFRQLYLRSVSIIALIAFPMVFGVMATSDRLVAVLFGPAWTEAGRVLAILAPVGLVQVITVTAGAIYHAKGRGGLMLAWGVLSGVATIVAFAIGLAWGVTGVASAYLVVTLVLAFPGLATPYRLIGLRVRTMLGAVARPAICGATMFAAIGIASRLIGLPVDSLPGFVLLAAAGVAIYAALTAAINRAAIDELIRVVARARAAS